MYEFIKTNQMDIMLALCASCMTMALLLLITKFLPRRRKWILIGMELVAVFLLFFDRLAYIYAGDMSPTGYVMIRVSNFMVFFLTSGIVLNFNIYIIDLINEYGKLRIIPKRLMFTGIASIGGMLLAVISAFTGIIYTFDANNHYHRGPWFLVAYVIPVIGPLIQYTVAFQYRKKFSIFINTALFLYIFVPIIMGIIQIFTYGISIVNMAMVMVSVSLYVFSYLDINETVVKSHILEMENLQKEQKSMKRLFEQTAGAFVKAVEKKDEYLEGHSEKVAEVARRIAIAAGKSPEEQEEIFYTALLHDIGMIGIPDSITEKDELNAYEKELIRQKPLLSAEILSAITEYPYLSLYARYCYERYDGSGYPEGLKGNAIPEVARIIYLADAYVAMSSPKKYRDALPMPIIREELIKGNGEQFDPYYTDILIKLLDADVNNKILTEEVQIETELQCGTYRDKVSAGIAIENTVTNISFLCMESETAAGAFSQPSIILFDSFDRHVYNREREIEAFKYTEYGELWFDGHSVTTNARNILIKVTEHESEAVTTESAEQNFFISARRFEDHLMLVMDSRGRTVKAIVALPDKTKSAYIGITGENCYITGINIENTEDITRAEDIPRIEDELDYTDRMVSDVPNIQIDRPRSASTEGIAIRDHLKLKFHSVSLPSATLVWHCPYIVLFYSDDKKVYGEGYREYAMIKLNGESDEIKEFAHNKVSIKKKEQFKNWNVWKDTCRKGMECEVLFKRKGNTITTVTENLGISIENITTINGGNGKVYVALSGDQVALTDIRIL
jgi:hypothetical protein